MQKEGLMTTREELHRLVDHIPESEVATTQKLLRALVDPVELAILSAEEDNEPEGEDERAAVEAALADPSADVPFEPLRSGLLMGGSFPTLQNDAAKKALFFVRPVESKSMHQHNPRSGWVHARDC